MCSVVKVADQNVYYTAVFRRKGLTPFLKFWRYWYQNSRLIVLYMMIYISVRYFTLKFKSKGHNRHSEALSADSAYSCYKERAYLQDIGHF